MTDFARDRLCANEKCIYYDIRRSEKLGDTIHVMDEETGKRYEVRRVAFANKAGVWFTFCDVCARAVSIVRDGQ